MKTAFQIFRRDVRRLLKNRAATLVMIGVCLLPSLYAWFNIAANMDPYANTSGIKVAIANCDTGTKTDVITMNAGDSIVEKLKENKSLGWQFVSEEKAKEGVQAGDYYAAIVIPENFSSSLVSILSGDLKRPKLDYYVNEKKNAIAPKITDTARCLTARYTAGMVNHTAMNSAVMEVHPVLTPERMEKRQNGRRMKEDGEPMFTLTSQDRHGVYFCEKPVKSVKVKNATKTGYEEAHLGDGIVLAYPNSDTRRGRVGKGCSQTLDTGCQMGTLMRCGRIRRLTPKECFRLQGFPDELYERAASVNSDSQLYKQAGNAVTATVAYALAMCLPESQKDG